MKNRIVWAGLFCAALPCALAGCAGRIDIPAETRPAVAQPLEAALALHARGDNLDAMQQIKIARAVPHKTGAENQIVARVQAKVTGRFTDCNICDMAPSGVPDFGPIGGPVTDQQPH